ncbi:MAG: hypothetical protein JXA03_09145 [Bacteroidales bacterium]|nr:hypothetical protein [Bacteroidales bacterium]
MKRLTALIIILTFRMTCILNCIAETKPDSPLLLAGFLTPANEFHPETWFHLIGGNVSLEGLTVDLEAVKGANIQGIQLFHGRGQEWPGVKPQITCLSESWDEMIAHVGRETGRLGLKFTMQNCPGWAMSGGPWITPDRAMRHLIWSRMDVVGGKQFSVKLTTSHPDTENWRDYRDVAVLAFPTPAGDTGQPQAPLSVQSNRPDLPWAGLLAGKPDIDIQIGVSDDPVWVEIFFDKPTFIRSVELPPLEHLMQRRIFNPASSIRLQAFGQNGWIDAGRRKIPRSTWQDRQPEMSLWLAFNDVPAKQFRIVFENKYPMSLKKLQLYAAARVNDWIGQAGYALRSLDRSSLPRQDSSAWITSVAVLDLTDKFKPDGSLIWDAPAGNWTIVRFGHVNTGVKNKPAPPEATGFECDKLSTAGADQHFAGYIGRLTQEGGAIAGQLKGMLIDSWECYTQTWTPDMEHEFESRRGYPLRQWLPAIAGWVIDNHTASERFLRDWRATINDLLVENYFGRLAELGRAHGLKLSFETAIGDVSPGDILQYFSKADIPMCEFWQPNDPHWGGFETKPIHPTVSAAHIYGKPIIAAESFTNIGIQWNEHPFMLKHKADQHFTLGINHLVFHTYTHNPRLDLVPGTSFGSRIGTPFLRGQTWWQHMPLFIDYLSRCQYMLQQGRPITDVLWYLGDDLDHKPRQDTLFPDGYKFDYINFDALVNRIHVVDGRLTTPEGLQWQVLWLPELTCRRLLPATLTKLQKLLQAGAIIIGPPPLQNPSLAGGADADSEFEALVKTLWGARTVSGDRRLGKGRLLWGGSLMKMLQKLGIKPDVIGTHSATWCHRQTENLDLYFISADRLSPLNANIRFRALGKPELWDPMTGKTQPVMVYQQIGAYTCIPVDLPVAGSTFLIFRPEAINPVFKKISHNNSTWLDAADTLKIDQGKPYPVFGLAPQDTLQPWIKPAPLLAAFNENGRMLVAWEDGNFNLTRTNGDTRIINMEGTKRILLNESWSLSFPAGWGVPEKIDLPNLKPWTDLCEPAIKAFSGTAVYSTRFSIEKMKKNISYLLDLGRVAHIAEILVNGKTVQTIWAPPFRADITHFIHQGINQLTVKVTNTWHNRLIYDAGLPESMRKTWTYHSPQADAILEPAGLIGPVEVRLGRMIEIVP